MFAVRVLAAIAVLVTCAPALAGVSAALAEEDACCAQEAHESGSEDSSSEGEECPCPEGCDDDCACCARPAVDSPGRVSIASRVFARVRYPSSVDRSPGAAEPDEREPVPRVLARA